MMSALVKVTLETEDGRPVGTAEIPPFRTPPVVIVWGQRFFTLQCDVPGCDLTYRESFTFVVTEVHLGGKLDGEAPGD
jgi:hypothetical protein